MYCTRCGSENLTDSKFCQVCGEKLNQQVSLSHPPTMGTIRRSGLAQASLVLGIIGLFINPCAILAIILGAVAIKQMGKDTNITGRGMAVAGLAFGILVVMLWVIAIVIFYRMGAFHFHQGPTLPDGTTRVSY